MTFDEEAERLGALLSGKVVKAIFRHRANESVVEFTDGGRLIVDTIGDLEISVT